MSDEPMRADDPLAVRRRALFDRIVLLPEASLSSIEQQVASYGSDGSSETQAAVAIITLPEGKTVDKFLAAWKKIGRREARAVFLTSNEIRVCNLHVGLDRLADAMRALPAASFSIGCRAIS